MLVSIHRIDGERDPRGFLSCSMLQLPNFQETGHAAALATAFRSSASPRNCAILAGRKAAPGEAEDVGVVMGCVGFGLSLEPFLPLFLKSQS